MEPSETLVLTTLFCLAVSTAATAQVQVTFRDGVSPSSTYDGVRDLLLTSEAPSVGSDPDTNYETLNNILDGFPTRNGVLLRCDVTAIPPGTTVLGAELETRIFNASPQAYSMHGLLVPWTSSQATWNVRMSNVPWSIPGARHEGVDIATPPVGLLASTTTGTITHPLNAAGVDMVQRWVDDPTSNHGLAIHDYENRDGLDFRGVDAANVSERPALRVTTAAQVFTFRNGESPVPSYSGCADTTISTGPVNGNYNGLSLALFGNAGSAAEVRTSLLAFDLSSLPPDARVTSAAIEVYVHDTTSASQTLRELLKPWSETEATWTMADVNTAWETPGAVGLADAHPAPLADPFTLPVQGPTTVPLNDAGIEIVQSWVRGDRPNHGFLLQQDPAAASFAGLRDSEHLVAASRPALHLAVELPDGGNDADGGGEWDAGIDAGPPEDAGTPDDAGVGDGGVGDGGSDAGEILVDAGRADAGTAGPRHLTVGCSQGATGALTAWLAAVVALCLLRAPRLVPRRR